MTMTIREPAAPATSRQLWLLHILTKTDTRELKLTKQQASDKISELKQATGRPLVNLHASAVKRDKQTIAQQKYDKQFGHLTGYGLNLGALRVVQAFKEIAMHGKDSIAISLKASAIFPGGRKQHIITVATWGGEAHISPLFAHRRNYFDVPEPEYRTWVKSLPVQFNKYNFGKIPEDWKRGHKVMIYKVSVQIVSLSGKRCRRDGESLDDYEREVPIMGVEHCYYALRLNKEGKPKERYGIALTNFRTETGQCWEKEHRDFNHFGLIFTIEELHKAPNQ